MTRVRVCGLNEQPGPVTAPPVTPGSRRDHHPGFLYGPPPVLTVRVILLEPRNRNFFAHDVMMISRRCLHSTTRLLKAAPAGMPNSAANTFLSVQTYIETGTTSNACIMPAQLQVPTSPLEYMAATTG